MVVGHNLDRVTGPVVLVYVSSQSVSQSLFFKIVKNRKLFTLILCTLLHFSGCQFISAPHHRGEVSPPPRACRQKRQHVDGHFVDRGAAATLVIILSLFAIIGRIFNRTDSYGSYSSTKTLYGPWRVPAFPGCTTLKELVLARRLNTVIESRAYILPCLRY